LSTGWKFAVPLVAPVALAVSVCAFSAMPP
jgi:hypothetical protein